MLTRCLRKGASAGGLRSAAERDSLAQADSVAQPDDADDAAAALLRAELPHLEKTVKIPDGAGEGPVKLLSALPLTVSFSLLRVARTDEAEELLVAMI